MWDLVADPKTVLTIFRRDERCDVEIIDRNRSTKLMTIYLFEEFVFKRDTESLYLRRRDNYSSF